MLISLTPSPASTEQLLLEYPRGFAPEGFLANRSTTSVTNWGKLEINECWFDGACLLCSHFKVKDKARVTLQCDSFCWLMNFVLEGGLNSSTVSTRMQFQADEYHTFYCSELNMQLAVEQDTRVFTICLSRRFVQKLLGREILPEQFEAGADEPITLVTSDQTNGRVNMLINEIMNAKQPVHIRRIYLEAKILELLSMQLEALEQKTNVKEQFPQKDVERLQQARALIEANIKTPCSLIELARKTGLNDFKLKKGFKAMYGNTVFGYLTDLRMEQAYRLLKEGRSIAEVSDIVGYKNPHHFTAAFKKKYNLLPSKVGGR